jgi:8-oxo-dGTP diphosphatase
MTNTIIDVAAAIVINKGKFLSAKRLGGYLHNLWEFPGGKLEKYETPKLAAERELEEELGIKAVASETVLVLDYAYPDKSVRLHFVLCS